MGTYTLAEIVMICNLLEKYQLHGREIINKYSIDEIREIYNGAGPDSWIELSREILTALMSLFKPVIMIHDLDFNESDGTEEAFQKVTARWKANCKLIMDAEYPLWTLRQLEREYRLTRGILETLLAVRHPVTIVTKSSLIERDIDLLVQFAQQQLVQVFISVTSLDNRLSQLMEPRAAAPTSRLKTIRALSNAGIPVSVLVAPVIPFINEPEIEAIVDESARAGARSVHYTVLRMPWEVAELSRAWLETHFPDRADRVLKRVQEMRGGKDNDPQFGSRMKGRGVWAELIKARVHAAARRNQLPLKRLELDTSLFDPTPLLRSFEPRLASEQIELFA